MRLKGFLILLGLLCFYASFAQTQGELTQSRILILLDESSSMIQKWPSGKEKYKAADELILRLMDSIYAINPDVEFSLRVFGHQYTVEQNNCYDTKNEVPFSKDNRTQMALRLEDIHPLGVTPIAYALLQAAKFDLADEEHNAYSIVLFTDGGESCGGDICEVMKKLMKYKVYFKPYIVSLEDDPTLKTTYSCMGDFLQVTKDADMPKAVTTIVNAFRPAIKITKVEYKQMQTLATNVPSALKVSVPVIKPEIQPDDKTEKKEPGEITLPKPVKKKADSVAKPVVQTPKTDTVAAPKPVTKIKIDETPVKPPAEKIARLAIAEDKLLHTSAPGAKSINTVPVLPVEVTVLPPSQHISAVTLAQLKQVTIQAPATKTLKPLQIPAVEIAVKPQPEQLTALTLAHPKPVIVQPAKTKSPNTVQTPDIDITVKPEADRITALVPAHAKPVTVSPVAGKVLKPIQVPAIDVTVKPGPDRITALMPAHLKPVENIIYIPGPQPKRFVTPPPAPAIVVPVAPESITRIAVIKPLAVSTSAPATKKPRTVQLLPMPALIIDIPAAPKPVDKIAKLKPTPLRPANIIFVIEDKAFVPRKVPPMPPLKIDIPKVPVTKTTTPANEPVPFKKAEYTVITEDAKETSVEIYITNGHGKYFTSTPQMMLLEPGTNKVVKTFYRTVDASGNPDAITNFPAGTFNIALSAAKTLGVNNVKIEANKKNKITVTVLPASLSFAYDDAPKRPIVEFVARVTERNKAQGRVVDQKCTAELEYDPGNYHIMINTFPQIDRNVDLDFAETIIHIPQPGFVNFTHDDKTRTVILYKQEGDKFLSFHTLDLKDVATQPLRMQPGEYQAHYHNGPGGNSSASEKVVTFFVKATQTTTVELK